IDRLELAEEALPGGAPAGVIEELDPVGLLDDLAQLLDEAVAGQDVGRDRADRRRPRVARIAPEHDPGLLGGVLELARRKRRDRGGAGLRALRGRTRRDRWTAT